ncbi:MAG: RHS repeat-associated core domain-containing protein, partial [Flavobacterium sp.]
MATNYATVNDFSDRDEGFKDGLNAINNINDYLYDTNGNMISDMNKEISLITYNHLNLPTRIEMAQGVIEYFYDASGVKQKKRVTYPNNHFSETYYAGGFVYTKTQATTVLEDFDFYFTPEGYAKKENGVLSYVYQYKDHLGNVRTVIKRAGLTNTPFIDQYADYYPFGE